jgi:hypothetical protein
LNIEHIIIMECTAPNCRRACPRRAQRPYCDVHGILPRCMRLSCELWPTFGAPGRKARHCYVHKTAGEVRCPLWILPPSVSDINTRIEAINEANMRIDATLRVVKNAMVVESAHFKDGDVDFTCERFTEPDDTKHMIPSWIPNSPDMVAWYIKWAARLSK